MKTKTALNLIQDAEYEEFSNVYKRLLGYEKNTEFFTAHPEVDSLIKYINDKLGCELDPAYIAFMKDSNGCRIDCSTIYSFKHEEQEKDVLFVNFDKKIRKDLQVAEGAFIAGKYQNSVIVYDKASHIDSKSDSDFLWGIYSIKHQKFIADFYNFLELIEFLIQDLIDFFVEED